MDAENPMTYRILCTGEGESARQKFAALFFATKFDKDETAQYEIEVAALDQLELYVRAACMDAKPYAVVCVEHDNGDVRLDESELVARLLREDPDIHVAIRTTQPRNDEGSFSMPGSNQCFVLAKGLPDAVVAETIRSLAEVWGTRRAMGRRCDELRSTIEESSRGPSNASEMTSTERLSAPAPAFIGAPAQQDLLTELPNRVCAFQHLQICVERLSATNSSSLAVGVFDLDNFNVINESLGFSAGDWLLRDVARRLTAALEGLLKKHEDVVGSLFRLERDQFLLVLEAEAGSLDSIASMESLRGTLDAPCELEGHTLFPSTTVGVVTVETAGDDVDAIVRDAQFAVSSAKSSAKGTCVAFREEMRSDGRVRRIVEHDLRRAIEQRQLVLNYQPVVELRDGRVDSFEALSRWNHPERGMIAANTFIRLAEESQLIFPLGLWALRQACREARSRFHGRADSEPVAVSVNLSEKSFFRSNLCDELGHILREEQLDARWLRVEIPGPAILRGDHQATARVVQCLSEHGVLVDFDDFGLGGATLRDVQALGIGGVKLDRALVAKVDQERGVRERIAEILREADSLGIKVVAKGVERAAQVSCLGELGCRAAQGYFFSPPVSASDARELLQQPAWRGEVADLVVAPTRI